MFFHLTCQVIETHQGNMSNNNIKLNQTALFGSYDDEWRSTTRSIRIDGTVTSVRLENIYWRVIDDIAKRNRLRVPQLMTELQLTAKTGDTMHTNFTSFVRVCCCRYLDGITREPELAGTNISDSRILTKPGQVVSDVD